MELNGKIVVISGPTASGKTGYSIELAKKHNGIIINADSMQIYKHLPILSAQPTEEEKDSIEHLLFSHLEPNQNCNVGLWLNLAKDAIDYAINQKKTPIIVGGTGMYLSKLINGLSQIPETPDNIRKQTTELYNSIGHEEFYKKALDIDFELVSGLNKNDKQRLMRVVEIYTLTGKSIGYFQKLGNKLLYPREKFFHININPPREKLYQKCNLRFRNMVEKDNVLNEIKNFKSNFPEIIADGNFSICKTIGLLEGIKYLNGEISLDDFINKSVQLTRNYAKRQYTWFNHQFDEFDLRVE